MKQTIQPIFVQELFPEMRAELVRVLRSLNDEQWQMPTACAEWSVKDVALHILADDMGYLSRHRDKDGIEGKFDNFDDLVVFINELNQTWVDAARRLSRRLLIELLEFTGVQFDAYLQTVDVYADTSPISWAGNQPSPMWLQIARELTEFWMHHQHICEGAGIDSLKNERFLGPVLSTFVHALPRTYRDIVAPIDTLIVFKVTGEVQASWHLVNEGDYWALYQATDMESTTTITIPAEIAWKIFTKGIAVAEARNHTQITGDIALGLSALSAVAILA